MKKCGISGKINPTVFQVITSTKFGRTLEVPVRQTVQYSTTSYTANRFIFIKLRSEHQRLKRAVNQSKGRLWKPTPMSGSASRLFQMCYLLLNRRDGRLEPLVNKGEETGEGRSNNGSCLAVKIASYWVHSFKLLAVFVGRWVIWAASSRNPRC